VDELGAGGCLDQYYLFRRSYRASAAPKKRHEAAASAHSIAGSRASNPVEIEFLNRRLREIVMP
jgi:hypothetical protein